MDLQYAELTVVMSQEISERPRAFVLRADVTTDSMEQRSCDVVGVLKIGAEVNPGGFYKLSDVVVIDDQRRAKKCFDIP